MKSWLVLNAILLPGELAVTALVLMNPDNFCTPLPFWPAMVCALGVFLTLNGGGALMHEDTKPTENEDEST